MTALLESDNEVFHQMLDEALVAIDKSGVPYVLMGGIAATALGGHRFTHDIDVLVKAEEAEKVLDALAAAGFKTEKTDPVWLFKGFKNNVMVDVIFKSSGEIRLDEEMLERSSRIPFRGREIRAIAPEDLLVIKALVLNENSLSLDTRVVRHLHDFLTIIRTRDLDWDYVIRRARHGPKRVLGLLLYAQSLDLLVPNRVIRTLAGMLDLC